MQLSIEVVRFFWSNCLFFFWYHNHNLCFAFDLLKCCDGCFCFESKNIVRFLRKISYNYYLHHLLKKYNRSYLGKRKCYAKSVYKSLVGAKWKIRNVHISYVLRDERNICVYWLWLHCIYIPRKSMKCILMNT